MESSLQNPYNAVILGRVKTVSGTCRAFDDPLIKIYLSLCEAEYDVIPCASNCYGLKENFPATAMFCKENLPPEHFGGMLMAPWVETRAPYGRLLREASSLVAEARRRVGAEGVS